MKTKYQFATVTEKTRDMKNVFI